MPEKLAIPGQQDGDLPKKNSTASVRSNKSGGGFFDTPAGTKLEASPKMTEMDDSSSEESSSVVTSASSYIANKHGGKDPAALNAALLTAKRVKETSKRKADMPRGRTPPPGQDSRRQNAAAQGLHFKAANQRKERAKCHHGISDHMDDEPDLDNVVHFCYWGKDNFKVLYELFRFPDATGKYLGCRAVPVEEFVDYISRSGFNGDVISIVREIYKCAPPGVIALMNASSIGSPTYEITMPMLQKFIRANEHLIVGQEWSPINEFKKLLLDTRGSYLRAWRLDIDLFNTGTVPYMTFIQACHKLQRGHHSQAIWNSFRPDATTAPLEFAEFAPEEAANLEAFTQTLWVSCQFNMYKAWEVIDVSERLWVPESEFVEGVTKLGFEGDAVQIYRGLDTYGLGRLWRRELEYLKTLFTASSRTPHGTPQIKILRAWAKELFGGAEGFLARLGMEEGKTDVQLSPQQLSSGLVQLNYPGDCDETAHLVSRAAGISDTISREILLPLVSGERPAAPAYIQRTIKSFKETNTGTAKKRSGTTPTPAEKMEYAKALKEREYKWNDSVDDLCLVNEDKCSSHRTYFRAETSLRSGDLPERPRSTTPVRKSNKSPLRVSFKVVGDSSPTGEKSGKDGKPKKDKGKDKSKKDKKEKKKDKKEKKEKKDEGAAEEESKVMHLAEALHVAHVPEDQGKEKDSEVAQQEASEAVEEVAEDYDVEEGEAQGEGEEGEDDEEGAEAGDPLQMGEGEDTF